jgi:hypothetical protein
MIAVFQVIYPRSSLLLEGKLTYQQFPLSYSNETPPYCLLHGPLRYLSLGSVINFILYYMCFY